MSSIIALLFGIILIVVSIIVIIVTKDRTNNIDIDNIPKSSDTIYNDLIDNYDKEEIALALSSLEGVLEEMNFTFNSTVNQFEKRYAEIEGKIRLLDDKVAHGNEDEDGTTENDVDIEGKIEYINPIIRERLIQIRALKAEGLNNAMIAKKLNIGTGEVNLITNIMNKSNKN